MRNLNEKGDMVIVCASGRKVEVKNLTKWTKDLLAKMGSEYASKLQKGESWIFIGRKGFSRGKEKWEK